MEDIISLLNGKNGLLCTIFAAVMTELMAKLLLNRLDASYLSSQEYVNALRQKFKIFRNL